MGYNYKNFSNTLGKIGPIILLYFLSITELHTEFSNLFEILSFNLQLIIVYYWMLKQPSVLGNGHVFFAGLINDIVMALPMGASALCYLIVSFVASYMRNVTVNKSLFTDWFTFLVAIFFSNLTYFTIVAKFTNLELNYTVLFYNSFFTFLFFPMFWVIFNFYRTIFFTIND